MKDTLYIIAISALAAGMWFSDNKNKEQELLISSLQEEKSDYLGQIRSLENEIKSLSRNLEKKQEELPKQPHPPVVSVEKEEVKEPIAQPKQSAEEPKKDNFLENYYKTQEERSKIISQIREIEGQISSTEIKLHDKERSWAIEDSKRGIRTSQHERDELRESVRSYISNLESQKRELQNQLNNIK